jgi:hypothetical protein
MLAMETMPAIEVEKMEIAANRRHHRPGAKPAVSRLIRRDGTLNKTYYDLLKYNLDELAASTGGIPHIIEALAREMEIC